MDNVLTAEFKIFSILKVIILKKRGVKEGNYQIIIQGDVFEW